MGLAYRQASDEALHRAVEDALLCTHVHPDAVDGAFIQARAVALAARTICPSELAPERFVRECSLAARTTVMQAKLEAVVSGLQHDDSRRPGDCAGGQRDRGL